MGVQLYRCVIGIIILWSTVSAVCVAQHPSTLTDLQVVKEDGTHIVLNDVISNPRNHILFFTSDDDTSSISILNAWAEKYNTWAPMYAMSIFVINLSATDYVPASFNSFRSLNLPFRYYVASEDFEDIEFLEMPMALYYSENGQWQGQGMLFDVDEVENYMQEWDFLNRSQQPIKAPTVSQFIYSGSSCASATTSKLQLDRDTIIQGLTYIVAEYEGENFFIRESADRSKIWRLLSSGEEGLIADFRLNVCDTFYSYGAIDETPIQCIIEEKKFIERRLHLTTNIRRSACKAEDSPLTFIRYIGSNSGLVFHTEDNDVASVLLCHYYNNQPIYRNDIYDEDCYVDFSSTDNRVRPSDIRLFPNPVQESLTIEGSKNGQVIIYSVVGKEVMRIHKNQFQLTIPCMDWAPGAYILSLESDQELIIENIIKW